MTLPKLLLPDRTESFISPNLNITAVFGTADAAASMVRTRLRQAGQLKAADKDNEVSVDDYVLMCFTYPDFMAALRHLNMSGTDAEGQPFEFDTTREMELPFELYKQLPEIFLMHCETAIYALNEQWKMPVEDDPKVPSAPGLSIKPSSGRSNGKVRTTKRKKTSHSSR